MIDIGTPGWIFGKHPTHHDKETIKTGMMDEIKKACPDSQIPCFHLASGTVGRLDLAGNFNTRAIVIHVIKKQAHTLHQLLKKTYGGRDFYIPWSWKKSEYADAFRDAMTAQMAVNTALWVVPIHGINDEQMVQVSQELQKSPTIMSIERTSTTASAGW